VTVAGRSRQFPRGEPARVIEYHAHVYYNAKTKPVAATVRARIEKRFPVRMGRWHDEPVGPHPISMYQVAFPPALFETLVPWLMTNRDGLDVLVHPETGDAYTDHLHYGMWLGTRLDLRLDRLPGGRASASRARAPSARPRRKARP
jgi:DOPA 4,5-dioxygenase